MQTFIPQFIVSQLLSYGVFPWLAFLAIAVVSAHWGRWLGVIAGQIAVFFLVGWLDVHYQESHPLMDLDAIFALGTMARVLLINTVLLPVSLLIAGYAQRLRRERQAARWQ